MSSVWERPLIRAGFGFGMTYSKPDQALHILIEITKTPKPTSSNPQTQIPTTVYEILVYKPATQP